jgi:hypothetical protein
MPRAGFGFGRHLDGINSWLQLRRRCLGDDPGWAARDRQRCGRDHAALAGAFVARWCAGKKPETKRGAFRFRDDAPTPRRTAVAPKSPP